MATSKKKAPKKLKAPKSSPVPEPTEVKPQPGYDGAFPTAYSNFASVSHTPTDLCIDFCLIAPPPRVDMDKQTAQLPVVSRVVIPAAMADSLAEAVKVQSEKAKQRRAAEINRSAPKGRVQ